MERNNIISDWLNEYGDSEIDKFVENQLNQNNMKAQLTFNLPDEEIEFNDAISGNAYKAVIWEIDQYLRSQLKHQDMSDEVSVKVLEIRQELHSIIGDHSLTMDQIWK